jgi:hypothetical protein
LRIKVAKSVYHCGNSKYDAQRVIASKTTARKEARGSKRKKQNFATDAQIITDFFKQSVIICEIRGKKRS